MMDIDPTSLISASPPLLAAMFLRYFLKACKATPVIPDWTIPFIALCSGASIWMAIKGFNVNNFIIGALIGWAAIGFHETLRQTTERIKEGPESEETRQFKRRADEYLKQTLAKPDVKEVTLVTPATPASVETIKKETDPTV